MNNTLNGHEAFNFKLIYYELLRAEVFIILQRWF